MSGAFLSDYSESLTRTRLMLDDFGARFQPISMATSAETAAFLMALVKGFAPTRIMETGSGFSSAVLVGALHVENNPEYAHRVREWLGNIGVDAGTFCSYEAFHSLGVDGSFLLFIDGDLQTRERTAAWLQDKLERAIVVIDDAQAGTFVQVQNVLDLLKSDPRGRLIDCAAWTRDDYTRSAAMWIGNASGLQQELIDEIIAGPAMARPPVRLLMCINDTPENARWECTVRSLTSIGVTVDVRQHPMWIIDNGSTCPIALRFLQIWSEEQRRRGADLRMFRLPDNRGATYAFNRLLALVPPSDCVIRVENDIEFHTFNWPALMCEFLANSGFGLVCTKPMDLPMKALGIPTTRVAGVQVQEVDQVPGYCTAISPPLRSSLGALVCAGVYIEDILTSKRARVLGHRMAFLDPEELRCYHVDRSVRDSYSRWKQSAVTKERGVMMQALADWDSGARPAYAPFEFVDGDGFHEVI